MATATGTGLNFVFISNGANPASAAVYVEVDRVVTLADGSTVDRRQYVRADSQLTPTQLQNLQNIMNALCNKVSTTDCTVTPG